jgi:hypothetical protein
MPFMASFQAYTEPPAGPPSQVHSLFVLATQYHAVCSNGSSFSLNPFIAFWRPLTNVQVNKTTALHDTHGHTYIHHISIIILLFFYTFSVCLGRLAGPDPSRLTY